MKEKELEPIEREGIRVYDCPLCDQRIIGTLEEARKHVRIPLSRGVILPRGFTFGKRCMYKGDQENAKDYEIHVVTSSKQVDRWGLESAMRGCELGLPRKAKAGEGLTTHDFMYDIKHCIYNFWKKRNHPEEDGWDSFGEGYEWSNIFQEDFRKGFYFLLSEEQFKEFLEGRLFLEENRRGFPEDSELVRTVEGIGRWVE